MSARWHRAPTVLSTAARVSSTNHIINTARCRPTHGYNCFSRACARSRVLSSVALPLTVVVLTETTGYEVMKSWVYSPEILVFLLRRLRNAYLRKNLYLITGMKWEKVQLCRDSEDLCLIKNIFTKNIMENTNTKTSKINESRIHKYHATTSTFNTSNLRRRCCY